MAQYKRRHERNDVTHLVNYKIPFTKLRIVNEKGEQLGILSKDEGLKRSKEVGLDFRDRVLQTYQRRRESYLNR